MSVIPAELQQALAALEELVGGTALSEDAVEALRIKAYEYLDIVRPAFINGRIGEWDVLATRVQDRFGAMPVAIVEVDSALVHAPQFKRVDRFEDIVGDGFFGDYLKYTAESEAPTQFHFGSMLTCVSAALARRPLIGWHAAPLYPNTYALLVGPTGTRKSSAIAKARELVQLAFPKTGGAGGYAKVNVLSNEGSPQGYAAELRNRSFETGSVSDGLIIASELTVMINREQYKLALGSWLTDWYDNMSNPWKRALRDSVYELPSPYVCFVGASNLTWLREIPESLIKAGYLPRHLIFQAIEKRHDRSNPRFDVQLRATLAAALATNLADIPEEIPLSPAAELLMDEWYLGKITRQERGEVDDLFSAWLQRKLPHALKTAVIWQLVDGGPRDALHAEWLARAIQLVDWMDMGVLTVYYALSGTAEGVSTETVLEYVERKGGALGLSALIRGLRNRYNSKSIKYAVQTLQEGGLVTVVTATGGTMVRMTDVARGGRAT